MGACKCFVNFKISSVSSMSLNAHVDNINNNKEITRVDTQGIKSSKEKKLF